MPETVQEKFPLSDRQSTYSLLCQLWSKTNFSVRILAFTEISSNDRLIAGWKKNKKKNKSGRNTVEEMNSDLNNKFLGLNAQPKQKIRWIEPNLIHKIWITDTCAGCWVGKCIQN